jgi:predicted nucleic acid-binding protein
VTTLADTGAVYALIDQSDAWHASILNWWRKATDTILLPVTVLPEVSYLLRNRIGPAAEEAFLSSVASGEFFVEPLDTIPDTRRASSLIAAHRDSGLGFVDATIVAMAERLGVTEILTTDRSHFSTVQPAHVPEFTLIPQRLHQSLRRFEGWPKLSFRRTQDRSGDHHPDEPT